MDPEKDELLSFLVECFPDLPVDKLAWAIIQCNSRDKAEAIDFVLAHILLSSASPVSDPAANLTRRDQLLLQLAEVFPEVDLGELGSIVDLKAKQSSDGCCDFEDVLEQLIDEVMIRHLNFVEDWDLNEEDDWLGVDSWRVQKLNRRKFKGVNWEPGALQTSSEPVSYAELLSPHTTRRQNIKTLPFYYQPFSLLPVLSRHDLGVQDLRDEISDLLKEKHAVLGKAAESYRKKGLTGYQTASYYAEQASSLDFKIRALKLAAAHRTFVKFNPDPISRALDLHGLTVDEAIPIVDAFLAHHIGEERPSQLLSPVTIITGAGKHSLGPMGPRLRPAVWRRLGFSDYRFNYDGHAVFTVFGKLPKK